MALNRLLLRQFKRNKINLKNAAPEIVSLAESISNSYEHFENSRELVERSMKLSNLELEEANSMLLKESKKQRIVIESLKEVIKDVSFDKKEVDLDDLFKISTVLKSEVEKRKEIEKNLKKARKFAEDSLKIKERFLANMSHEIRTPLNAILGMTWLLSKTKLTDKQKKYKEVLRTSAENLLVIINNILDISKITSGKLYLENIDFDLDKLLDNLIQTNSYKAIEKGIKLILIKDEKIGSFYNGDPNKLNQILTNLVGNAIKFTNDGFVKISIELEEFKGSSELIKFSVIDSGMGISKENIETIFDSFTQEDVSISRKFGGSGLGLSICKELTQVLGGEIHVESEKDKGSVFSFSSTIKRILSKEVDESEKIIPVKIKKDLKGFSILIVEDDEYNRIFLTTILEKWNVTIGIAENGLEAIEKLKKESFDLVLMDMHMPKMDGLTATKEIRTSLKLDVPIIALTADVILSKSKFKEVGMNGFIFKPFNPSELYSLIEGYMHVLNHNI